MRCRAISTGFPSATCNPNEPIATAEQVADALAEVLDELDPTLVLLPMGLANPEHVCVHDAALLVRERDGSDGPAWIAYQDIAYHQIPGQLAWRVAKLFKSAVWPTPVAMPISADLSPKREAMAEYVVAGQGTRGRLGAVAAPRRADPRAVLAPRPAPDGLGSPHRPRLTRRSTAEARTDTGPSVSCAGCRSDT